MFKANKLAQALAVAGVLGVAGGAQATTINNALTANVPNLVQDESREAYVDANHDGLFNAGDVIFGYVQINNFAPSGAHANNAVYGVFSQQITSIVGQSVTFGATSVAGLTLSALTGNLATPANAIASFYDNASPGGYTTDLITTALATATNMKDYIDFITGNGTLRLTLGLSGPSNFLVSEANNIVPLANGPNGAIVTTPDTVDVSSTAGGLSVLFNNTNFSYAPTVVAASPSGFTPSIGPVNVQFGVSGGVVSGSVGSTPIPQAWLNADYGAFNFQQCTVGANTDVACGFIDKNNFGVAPIRVPEPGSLVLVSGALLALVGVGRRRKDKHSD